MKDKKKKAVAIVLAAILVATAVLLYRYRQTNRNSENIRVSGNIEATEAEVAFKIPGHVEQRLVDEGQSVRQGQTVALLDTSDLTRQVESQKAVLAAAQAQLAELLAGSRPEEIANARAAFNKAQAALLQLQHGSRPQEIAAAKARVASARALKIQQERNYRRAEGLYRSQTISAQEYDQIRQAYESAAASLDESMEQLRLVQEGPRREEIEQAQAALAQARAQLELVEKGPRQEEIDQARARVQQAQATLDLAKVQLSDARLVSPLTGVVLSKNVEPGEYVSAGTPVVTVANLQDIWLRAYIDETDLGRVHLGQRARVTCDTYPGKVYEGRVSFISSEAEFTPKSVQTEKERVKLVYRVKIDIHNPAMELKPGMPADAVIDTTASQPLEKGKKDESR